MVIEIDEMFPLSRKIDNETKKMQELITIKSLKEFKDKLISIKKNEHFQSTSNGYRHNINKKLIWSN